MQSRPQRLGGHVRAELCALLGRSVRDPALRFVTVTRVEMTRDLQQARVYYTARSGTVLGDTARGLRRAAPFLRGQLGRRLQVRHVPSLTFVYDEALEREQRIAQVLDELQVKAPPPEADSDLGSS